MADAYIGEIRLFCGTFAPAGWAFCWGQTLPLRQYQTLFSIINNTYGGDGMTNFQLPDLRGRVPIHQGDGPGLTPRTVGENGGELSVALTTGEMPAHTHSAMGVAANGAANTPVNNTWAQMDIGGRTPVVVNSYAAATPGAFMNPAALGTAGNGGAHTNMQPYLPINYIICIDDGIYPVRD